MEFEYAERLAQDPASLRTEFNANFALLCFRSPDVLHKTAGYDAKGQSNFKSLTTHNYARLCSFGCKHLMAISLYFLEMVLKFITTSRLSLEGKYLCLKSDTIRVKLPSSAKKIVPSDCRAMIGQVVGCGRTEKPLLKCVEETFQSYLLKLCNLIHSAHSFLEIQQLEGVSKGPSNDVKKLYNLLNEAKQELYPGCESFSTLSFILRLYLLKCLHGWSNASFTTLLELLKEAMPNLNIPKSFYKTKSMIRDLGLDYQKIHSCPNDCMLYWKENENDDSCKICQASRWKEFGQVDCEFNQLKEGHKVPAKILRHFPLIPRLERLFMCSTTTESLRWHEEERSKDGKLRHPADGQAWKDFDRIHPGFASESRNLRLGLMSDGFNPFRTMSISHSTWPVQMMVYNLPPWLSMKSEYTILSLLIPGPQSPGKDIDVYLQPLIEELKELWDSGVQTYDASRNQTFSMRAALLWTISDYPGYAMLSGWSTKGHLACACCNYNTNSMYLRYSHKAQNTLRHNLDVMHIEKNIFDNIIGTLLDIPGKTKDHINARYDLQEMGIRKELHPREIGGGRTEFAKACFTMTSVEKSIFCSALKDAKLPDGTASNISKYVHVADKKISGYKSHDAHFMLHYLLQIAIKSIMPNVVADPLIRLGSFFRSICKKVIQVQDLDHLETEIAEILCQLEMCDWFAVEEDKYGLMCVHFNKKLYQDDPFVLSCQVHQCFYIEDPLDANRHYVMEMVPRDLFNIGDQSYLEAHDGYQSDLNASNNDNEPNWVREDIPATVIEKPLRVMSEIEYEEDSDSDNTLLDFTD
ncbi:hypothetical protein VNO77_23061 [Canavalia gladiata]|uniref:DUF4216 domain-containing protein n=1 Tax=Canavalia gladiata TaxID=3824 RepID=A0AAN9QBJ8_CANGL